MTATVGSVIIVESVTTEIFSLLSKRLLNLRDLIHVSLASEVGESSAALKVRVTVRIRRALRAVGSISNHALDHRVADLLM